MPLKNFRFIVFLAISLVFSGCRFWEAAPQFPVRVSTFAGVSDNQANRFGEPFGAAFDSKGVLYVSDGEKGAIWRVSANDKMDLVTDKLDTPSGIAFDNKGALIVADSGSHTIKSVNTATGEIATLAGVEGKPGFKDGAVGEALFHAPIGVAAGTDGKIYVADTYNDRIRVIDNGNVSTLAGGERGFIDAEKGTDAMFDTPCGVALMKDGGLLVADTGNARIRRVESAGRTYTVAGNGAADLKDGSLLSASFVMPTALTVSKNGWVFVADGNALRVIGRRTFPVVETLNYQWRGFTDGELSRAQFSRPSGLAEAPSGDLFVSDSENQAVRVLSAREIGVLADGKIKARMAVSAEQFRAMQPGRWPYDPADNPRDVAGTLGEVRGEVEEGKDVWFHNGLDIAGGYGETARFVRDEKVLRPVAVENYGGLRELIRMPTMGYVHIRIGRDSNEKPYDDPRFVFKKSDVGARGVRVPRGAKFKAGEAIGVLNRFNHVHLIAGRPGNEYNALAALDLPGIEDKVAPKIEEIRLFDRDWKQLTETETGKGRIKVSGKVRIGVQAYDQINEKVARRRLGLYRVGYRLFKKSHETSEPDWAITFDLMPDERRARSIYGPGSRSGYTPDTVFNYIATNRLRGETPVEEFIDTTSLEHGEYVLRVFAGDYFGNVSTRDVTIVVGE